jgi:NADH:ubiquinone oxidoreductase subunit E
MSIADPWAGTEEDVRRVEAILEGFEAENDDPLEALIPSLHRVQEHYRYVPEGAARVISERWRIPLTDIFGVVTFYADFRTEPMGRNVLWVCEGAACYFMGGPELGEAAQRRLGVQYNETTPDGEWTLRRADFCFGACHLAPLVDLNHKISGPLTSDGLLRMLDNPPAHHEGSHG